MVNPDITLQPNDEAPPSYEQSADDKLIESGPAVDLVELDRVDQERWLAQSRQRVADLADRRAQRRWQEVTDRFNADTDHFQRTQEELRQQIHNLLHDQFPNYED